jgi:hypothetical protein
MTDLETRRQAVTTLEEALQIEPIRVFEVNKVR